MSSHGNSGEEEVMFKDQHEVEEVSELSQGEAENVLNQLSCMSPEVLNFYLERKQNIHMDKIKMELEKEQMNKRYLLEAEKKEKII